MIKITAVNASSEVLVLNEANNYAVTDVQGLSPAAANINVTNLAGDGSNFNSAMIPQRNIVLTVYMLNDVEASRQALYKFFSPKKNITLLFENDNRKLKISGYVESFEGTFFSNSEYFQISVICPQPFLEDQTDETAALTAGENTVTNNGDYACGFNAELTVTSGASDISISDGYNTLTIDGAALLASDIITICTISGKISVKKGNTSLLNYISLTNGFPKLAVDDTTITLDNCSGQLTFTALYGGM